MSMFDRTVDPTWAEIVEVFTEKLALARGRLENPGNTRDEDSTIKGQIQAYKEVLNYKRSRDKKAEAGAGRTL